MNVSEKVVYYLRKHLNETICDKCLRLEFRASKPPTRMLDGFNREYCRRTIDVCGKCGNSGATVTMFR